LEDRKTPDAAGYSKPQRKTNLPFDRVIANLAGTRPRRARAYPLLRERVVFLMRRRLQKFLPIVLIALVMQVLAPIAACWAASIAVSDPFGSAAICHDNAASAPAQSDQGGDHRSHNGVCAICCIAQAASAIDTPQQAAVAAPHRQPARVVWRDQAVEPQAARAGSNTQARAPPSLS
jgi:Protein of unknown function (DUF2946)